MPTKSVMGASTRTRRTVVSIMCGVAVAVLASQFALAQPRADQAAARAARAKGAIEAIEKMAQGAVHQPGTLDKFVYDSREAVRTLQETGSAALPGIETALADPAKDARVKAMLCNALGRIKDEKADELLGRVLDDPTQPKMILAYAADGLGRKRTPTAIAVIKRAVMDTRLPVDIRSRMMMIAAAEGSIEDVGWLAKIALGEGIGLLADPKAEISQDEFTMILNAQRALAKLKDPRAVDVMISLVESHPSNGILVEGLGKSGDRRAIPVLIGVLTDTSIQGLARFDAAFALAELKAREAVDPLIEILQSRDDPALVSVAARALAKIGDKRALPAMEKLVANLKNDSRFSSSEWQLLEKGHGYVAQIMKALEELR